MDVLLIPDRSRLKPPVCLIPEQMNTHPELNQMSARLPVSL